MSTMRFTQADADAAYEAWGCNCGPAAIAAICGMTLDEVRPHLGDFDKKRYVNPSLMFFALRSIGREHTRLGTEWPIYGLARLQWEGPWTAPGVPMRARYRYTHWVGVWQTRERGMGIFDVNMMGNGTGWGLKADWEATIVPAITAHYPRASGGWHVTHGIEVERPNRSREAA